MPAVWDTCACSIIINCAISRSDFRIPPLFDGGDHRNIYYYCFCLFVVGQSFFSFRSRISYQKKKKKNSDRITRAHIDCNKRNVRIAV